MKWILLIGLFCMGCGESVVVSDQSISSSTFTKVGSTELFSVYKFNVDSIDYLIVRSSHSSVAIIKHSKQ